MPLGEHQLARGPPDAGPTPFAVNLEPLAARAELGCRHGEESGAGAHSDPPATSNDGGTRVKSTSQSSQCNAQRLRGAMPQTGHVRMKVGGVRWGCQPKSLGRCPGACQVGAGGAVDGSDRMASSKSSSSGGSGSAGSVGAVF